MQLDDGREVFRKLLQCRVDFLSRESRRDLFEDNIRVAGYEFVVRLLEPGDGHELTAPGSPFLGFAEDAPKNPVKPSTDAGWVPEIVHAKPGTAAGLLDSILGVRPDVGATRGEREQAIEMRQHQRVEARVPVGQWTGNGLIPCGAELL